MRSTTTIQTNNEVLNTIKTFMAAFRAKDIDLLMNHYDEKSIVVFDGTSPTYGKKDIRKLFIHTFSINPNLAIKDEQLFIIDNVAIHFSNWEMTGISPNGELFTSTGLSVLNLKKQKNGNWIILLDNPQALYLLNKNK